MEIPAVNYPQMIFQILTLVSAVIGFILFVATRSLNANPKEKKDVLVNKQMLNCTLSSLSAFIAAAFFLAVTNFIVLQRNPDDGSSMTKAVVYLLPPTFCIVFLACLMSTLATRYDNIVYGDTNMATYQTYMDSLFAPMMLFIIATAGDVLYSHTAEPRAGDNFPMQMAKMATVMMSGTLFLLFWYMLYILLVKKTLPRL